MNIFLNIQSNLEQCFGTSCKINPYPPSSVQSSTVVTYKMHKIEPTLSFFLASLLLGQACFEVRVVNCKGMIKSVAPVRNHKTEDMLCLV